MSGGAQAGGLPEGAAYHARYQPIVDLATGGTVAYAASLHAVAGGREMSPGELFRSVTLPGDAAALDLRGRTEAIRGAAGWLGGARLFVRLVPAMIAQPRIALQGLDGLAAEAGIEMAQIVVEVALGQGAAAMAHLARIVTRCRGEGCEVAVVDVGDARTIRHSAGALAPDFIKLGRSLAAALQDPGEHPAVVETIAAAHAAGSRVIAFGVEDAQQAGWVRSVGADWAQGYHFGHSRRRPA